MSGSESESSQDPVKKSEQEKQIESLQVEFAQRALDAFKNQAAYQALQQGITPGAIQQLGQMYDPMSVLSPEERQRIVQQDYQNALRGSAQAAEISEAEMARIRSGGLASPAQRAAINAAAEAELQSGLGDISRYASEQMRTVGAELAPRLGLHRADTPILDRGNLIGSEAVNAAGRLVSDVRGREAQAMLNYPLAASQANQAQQQLGWSRADVLADLNQRAFQNRLALSGQVGQQGLGLATAYNVPAGQESLKPAMSTESSGYSWGILSGSSRSIKKILAAPNGPKILEALKELPVAYWKYLKGEDQREHIGTFAEDFMESFGLGDGKTIDYRDLIGLMLVGLQELALEVGVRKQEEAA